MSIMHEKEQNFPISDEWDNVNEITPEQVLTDARDMHLKPSQSILRNLRDAVYVQIDTPIRDSTQRLVSEGAKQLTVLPIDKLFEVGRLTAEDHYSGLLKKFRAEKLSKESLILNFIRAWNDEPDKAWVQRQLLVQSLFHIFTKDNFEDTALLTKYGIMGVLVKERISPVIPSSYTNEQRDRITVGMNRLRYINSIITTLAERIRFPNPTEIYGRYDEEEFLEIIRRIEQLKSFSVTRDFRSNMLVNVYNPAFWENTGEYEQLANIWIAQEHELRPTAFSIFHASSANRYLSAQKYNETRLLWLAHMQSWKHQVEVNSKPSSTRTQRKQTAALVYTILPTDQYEWLAKFDGGTLEAMAQVPYGADEEYVHYFINPSIEDIGYKRLTQWRIQINDSIGLFDNTPEAIFSGIVSEDILKYANWVDQDPAFRARKEWLTDEGTLDFTKMGRLSELKEMVRLDMMRLFLEKAPDYQDMPQIIFQRLESKDFAGLTEELKALFDPAESHIFRELQGMISSIFFYPVMKIEPLDGSAEKYRKYLPLLDEYHNYLVTTFTSSDESPQILQSKDTIKSLLLILQDHYFVKFLLNLITAKIHDPEVARHMHPWADVMDKMVSQFSSDADATGAINTFCFEELLSVYETPPFRKIFPDWDLMVKGFYHGMDEHVPEENDSDTAEAVGDNMFIGFADDEVAINSTIQSAFNSISEQMPYLASTLVPGENILSITELHGEKYEDPLSEKDIYARYQIYLVPLNGTDWGGVARIKHPSSVKDVLVFFRSDGRCECMLPVREHEDALERKITKGLLLAEKRSAINALAKSLFNQLEKRNAMAIVLPREEYNHENQPETNRTQIKERKSRKRKDALWANTILEKGLEK